MKTTPRGDETRQQMMDYIQQNPGSNKLEVQEAVGLGWGTTIYNLGVLESLGRIQTLKDRGHVRLFDIDLPKEEIHFLCALREKYSYAIIARLDKKGKVQAYEVADELGVSRKTIRRTLTNMQRHGVLERTGRVSAFYSITKQAKHLLDRIGPGK